MRRRNGCRLSPPRPDHHPEHSSTVGQKSASRQHQENRCPEKPELKGQGQGQASGDITVLADGDGDDDEDTIEILDEEDTIEIIND